VFGRTFWVIFLGVPAVSVISGGDIGMTYAAVALTLLGLLFGVAFRLRTLIWFLALLVVASAAFSLNCGFGFLDTALAVMAVQTIVQGSFFAGLLIRAAIGAAVRERRAI
jgi:hypothetical protein